MTQMVREGVVPNSLERVGSTIFTILASSTDITSASEAAMTAHILRGNGNPSGSF